MVSTAWKTHMLGKAESQIVKRDVMLQLGKLQCIITCNKRHRAFGGITLYVLLFWIEIEFSDQVIAVLCTHMLTRTLNRRLLDLWRWRISVRSFQKGLPAPCWCCYACDRWSAWFWSSVLVHWAQTFFCCEPRMLPFVWFPQWVSTISHTVNEIMHDNKPLLV